jgi:hypothetical protein
VQGQRVRGSSGGRRKDTLLTYLLISGDCVIVSMGMDVYVDTHAAQDTRDYTLCSLSPTEEANRVWLLGRFRFCQW